MTSPQPPRRSRLVRCPDCGNLVSPNADACPRCGRRMAPTVGYHVGNVVFWLLLIFVLAPLTLFTGLFLLVALMRAAGG
jgi:hypothetical protein